MVKPGKKKPETTETTSPEAAAKTKPEAAAKRKLAGLGRIRINNRFLKKNLISLIAIAVLAAGTGTVYGTLHSMDADMGDDPIYGVNDDRYQVLVSGEGYKLNKMQEQDYKLQKKQNETNAARDAENPQVYRTPNGSRVIRSGSSYRYRYHGSSYTPSKTIRVSSDIKTGIDGLKEPVKAGDSFRFYVLAYAYPYGKKNVISSENIEVKVSGGTATRYKSKDGKHFYEVKLGDKDKAEITVTIKDKKNKKTGKLGPYKIKMSGTTDPSSSTDPTTSTEPEKKEFEISADVESESFDLGKGSVEESDTATVADVLKDAGIKISDDGSEIKYISGNFSKVLDKINSDELRGIYESEENISDDEEFDEEKYEKWLDDVKKELKKGIGKGKPFDSTYVECDPDLETSIKDLTDAKIKLDVHLYD